MYMYYVQHLIFKGIYNSVRLTLDIDIMIVDLPGSRVYVTVQHCVCLHRYPYRR